MGSNKKIVSDILENILRTRSGELSLQELEDSIENSLPGLDSKFPEGTRELIANVVFRVREKQVENSAAVLNTSSEFIYDENQGTHLLFDVVIHAVREYLGSDTLR